METGCLDPERNRVSIGGGGEAGPEPPERGKGRQLELSKGGNNMEEDEEEQPKQTCCRRIGGSRVSSHLIVFNLNECICRYSDCDHCVFFFQENKSYGVEPFALILCLHTADHHVTNNYDVQYLRSFRCTPQRMLQIYGILLDDSTVLTYSTYFKEINELTRLR
jgi:hypothetical protein